MASFALQRIYESGGWTEDMTGSIADAMQTTKIGVIDRILYKRLNVSGSQNVDHYISNQQKQPTDVEKTLKEARMKEAKRRKMELESKLAAVKESLNEYEEQKDSQVKVSLQDSKLRKQYMDDEHRKAADATDFARKLREEQVERERRRKQKASELFQKVQEELEDAEEQKRLKAEEEEYKKQQRLAEMRAKAEARQEKSEQLRKAEQDYRKLMQNKPLYKKIEENYTSERMMPGLERRKEEIAKKRQGFRPLNREELEEHARHIDEMKRELEYKRAKEKSVRTLDEQPVTSQRNLASKFTYSVLQHDTEAKAALEKELQERKRLAEKQKQYAAIVKEMYTPTIDSLKQKEMHLMQERLKNPVKSLAKRSSSSVPRDSMMTHVNSSLGEDYASSPKMSHPKFKKNTMIPEKKPKPEPKKVDYLGERRKFRDTYAHGEVRIVSEEWNEFNAEDLDIESKAALLKRKAERVEKAAKRQELLLSSANPADINGLEAVDQVNDMLIGSIKAKLSLLDQVAR